MKLVRRLLKNTHGYTLAELLLVITIFAIGIVPVYKMVVSGAKIQKAADETYEATLHAQSLLQTVKTQIEADVGAEYHLSRGLPSPDVKSWLKPGAVDIDPLLVNFLDIEDDLVDEKFHAKYNTDTFLYEVHIWHIIGGKLKDRAISFTAYKDPSLIPEFTKENTSDLIKVEIKDTVEKYFFHNESLIWTDLGENKPIGIGEITYDATDKIKIRANGIKGENIGILGIDGYSTLEDKVKLTYNSRTETLDSERAITHSLIIEDNGTPLDANDVIQLIIDLTTFPSGIDSKIIRIENNTGATVSVPVYNEQNLADIKIYPIQQDSAGNIIVENRNKLEPNKNFIIGVIVRDAYNSTFEEKNKILSKIVDVYSFDYNK